MKSNSILNTLEKIYALLDSKQRKKTYILLFFMFLGSIADVVSIASIVPYIFIVAKPEIIQKNSLISSFYNYFNFESPNQFFLFSLILIFLLFVVKEIITTIITFFQIKFSYQIGTDFSKKQLIHYMDKDFFFHKNTNSYLLTNNVMNVPTAFANGIFIYALYFLTEFSVLSIIIISIAIYNYLLLLILTGILLPVIYIFYKSIKNKVHKLGERKNKLQPEIYESLHQTILGYLELKLNNKEDYFIEKYIKNQKYIHKQNIYIRTYNTFPRKVVELGALSGILIISMYNIFTHTTDSMFFFLGIFVTASYRLMPSANRIINALMTIKNHYYALEILYNTQKQDNKNTTKYGSEEIVFREKIEVKNLHFKYPDNRNFSLKNLNFSLKKGTILGIAGESGVGKSTIVYLIMGFFQSYEGEIRVDGKMIDVSNIKSWRSKIGFVKQNNILIGNTILENITFGTPKHEINHEKLSKAIEDASLSKFINGLENGINCSIGEKGLKISDGQRQRIGIARALYHGADLFIFDEATNALDEGNEKIIIKSIENLKKLGKTIIIISHRNSTLKSCDEIINIKI